MAVKNRNGRAYRTGTPFFGTPRKKRWENAQEKKKKVHKKEKHWGRPVEVSHTKGPFRCGGCNFMGGAEKGET